MQPIFDERWHRRAVAADAAAVAVLARDAIAPLYRFCFYRVGRNRHLCEEVVQETLVRAIRQLARYDPQRARGNIFPWLTGLARNEIRRVLARESTTTSLETLWAKMDEKLRAIYAQVEAAPLTASVLERDETCEMVGATMSQLPPHYREALEAKYLEGRSIRELAAAWRTSEKAVESRLSRARKAFREVFVALAQNLGPEPG